ncbi:hypothetical protein GCM10009665_62920 [Kitasatospora nipponensis]|uniref:DUF4389 domain-containing protein n=1 Tax=Kitasatospora nipponensis TaxID=258049 RepID=A0ABN1WTJ8_9ACTN
MAQTQGGWTMPEATGPVEWLPTLDIPEPGRQRRWTVLLRWLLLVPQFIVLWVLAVVAFFVVIAGWFAALFTARLPDSIARYLTGYLGYETRVMASQSLLMDRYPPFALRPPADYPVQLEVRPGELNRLAVFFRLILMIPAAIISGLAWSGWLVLAFFLWVVVLVLGRMPRPVFEATAATLRYRMRFTAYALMLTAAYPKRLFGEEESALAADARSATRPLVLGTPGRVLLVAFLVLGLASNAVSEATANWNDDTNDNPAVSTAPAPIR